VIDCEGEIVTVMHDHSHYGHRYRRQWPTWKRATRRINRPF
jgi:hypothetical protein